MELWKRIGMTTGEMIKDEATTPEGRAAKTQLGPEEGQSSGVWRAMWRCGGVLQKLFAWNG